MQSRFNNNFPFNPNFSWDRQCLFLSKNPDDGAVPPPPPIQENFLLLTGEDFLLLDGDNLFLLE